MACEQPNYDSFDIDRVLATGALDTPFNPRERYLLVSNAPETLAVGNPLLPNQWVVPDRATLYKASIPHPSFGWVPYRVFLWHLNSLSVDYTFYVLASTSGLPGQVRNVRGYHEVAPAPFTDLGICIAKQQLYGGLPWIDPGPILITQYESTLWQATAPPGHLVGLLLEFEVSVSGSPFRIRTCASRIGPGDFEDAVVPAHNPNFTVSSSGVPQGVHIRGWWPKSRVTVPRPGVFDIRLGGPGPETHEAGIGEKGGPEVSGAGFARQQDVVDPYGSMYPPYWFNGEYFPAKPKHNDGPYGANLNYIAQAKNTGHEANNLYVSLVARGTDAFFFGAARLIDPIQIPPYGVPPIRRPDGPEDYCSLVGSNAGASILIPGGTQIPVVVEIEFAHAGSSTLPVQWVLSRTAIGSVPIIPIG